MTASTESRPSASSPALGLAPALPGGSAGLYGWRDGDTGQGDGELTYRELRSRLLLALALVNHRRTPDGLTARDVAAVHAALLGGWDAA